MAPVPDPYLTLSAIAGRGWTPALVRRFLGAPDKTARNPHNTRWPAVRLYLRSRIEAAEATAEFWQAWEGARVRSARATARHRARKAVAAQGAAAPVSAGEAPPSG